MRRRGRGRRSGRGSRMRRIERRDDRGLILKSLSALLCLWTWEHAAFCGGDASIASRRRFISACEPSSCRLCPARGLPMWATARACPRNRRCNPPRSALLGAKVSALEVAAGTRTGTAYADSNGLLMDRARSLYSSSFSLETFLSADPTFFSLVQPTALSRSVRIGWL